jgi:hypothetical protein
MIILIDAYLVLVTNVTVHPRDAVVDAVLLEELFDDVIDALNSNDIVTLLLDSQSRTPD